MGRACVTSEGSKRAIDRRVAEISVPMKISGRFVNSSAPNFASRTLQQGGLNVSATSKALSAAAQRAPLRLAAMLLDYLNAANARHSECRSYTEWKAKLPPTNRTEGEN
jgi:hypothetical protein